MTKEATAMLEHLKTKPRVFDWDDIQSAPNEAKTWTTKVSRNTHIAIELQGAGYLLLANSLSRAEYWAKHDQETIDLIAKMKADVEAGNWAMVEGAARYMPLRMITAEDRAETNLYVLASKAFSGVAS
jgi:hypothetical protein